MRFKGGLCFVFCNHSLIVATSEYICFNLLKQQSTKQINFWCVNKSAAICCECASPFFSNVIEISLWSHAVVNSNSRMVRCWWQQNFKTKFSLRQWFCKPKHSHNPMPRAKFHFWCSKKKIVFLKKFWRKIMFRLLLLIELEKQICFFFGS